MKTWSRRKLCCCFLFCYTIEKTSVWEVLKKTRKCRLSLSPQNPQNLQNVQIRFWPLENQKPICARLLINCTSLVRFPFDAKGNWCVGEKRGNLWLILCSKVRKVSPVRLFPWWEQELYLDGSCDHESGYNRQSVKAESTMCFCFCC